MKGVDLARASGVSTTTISRYRNGERAPGGAELVAIAKALGVSPEELLGSDAIVPSGAGTEPTKKGGRSRASPAAIAPPPARSAAR